jgi:protein-disulfide isomerase
VLATVRSKFRPECLAVLLVVSFLAASVGIDDPLRAMASPSQTADTAETTRRADGVPTNATPTLGAQALETPQARFERFWVLLPKVTLSSVPNQRVVVVEFIDYLCKSCWLTRTALHEVLERFQQSHPGQVTVVSKDYPLDQSCNPELRRQVHPEACDAAVLARIAKRVGRSLEIENWLRTLTLGQASAAAETPALRQTSHRFLRPSDVDRFFATELALVKADVAEARALGVSGTPTIFVNGRHSDSLMNPVSFEMALSYELSDRRGR